PRNPPPRGRGHHARHALHRVRGVRVHGGCPRIQPRTRAHHHRAHGLTPGRSRAILHDHTYNQPELLVVVYLNGEFVPHAEARIPVDDRGFLFADGVYEVALAYDGRLYEMDAHLRRLEQGLRALRIEWDG